MTNDLLNELETVEPDSFAITDRERTLCLIEEYDLEAQLLAIRSLIKRNAESDEALEEDIEALGVEIRKHTDEYADYLQDLWIDHLNGAVFQDAAHSMSAVGMLAPFVESLFVAIFAGIRVHRQSVDGASNASAATHQDDFWNPHYVFEGNQRRRDVAKGVVRLANFSGLTAYLPDSLPKTLSALFAYRNRMFHNGFEWPMAERENFAKAIRQNQWPSEWFTQSTRAERPWIFYMSAEFIGHCLATIDQVLDGVGKYLNGRKREILDRASRTRAEETWQVT